MKSAAGLNQREMEWSVENGEPGIVSAERLPNALNRGLDEEDDMRMDPFLWQFVRIAQKREH